jgi:drug/metabolite transporter (DMT)-like permease
MTVEEGSLQESVFKAARPATLGYLPYLALGVGTLGLALSPMFVRWSGAPGPVAGFYRVSIAAVVMALPVLARARRQAGGVPLARAISWRHLLLAALAGLFFSGDLATWNTGVLLTNATNATLLGNTAPIWVSLVALVLFKEKLGRVFWGGLALVMIGALVILGGDFLGHPTLGLGDLLALTAGVFYGAFLLTTQRAREGLSSMLTWWVAAVASSLSLLVITRLLHQPLTGYTSAGYISMIAAALVSQVAGYLSISYALGYLPASIVSPTLLGQPVLTAVLAVPLLNEAISWPQVAGGALVLAGIWFVNRPRETEPGKT